MDISRQTGMIPANFFYERRSSTLANPVPASTSGYALMTYYVPANRQGVLVYGIGTDQHISASYTWVFDGIELPISGPARVGSIENPYVFPEPIMVSSSIILYIENAKSVAFPNTNGGPEDDAPFECVVHGRYT